MHKNPSFVLLWIIGKISERTDGLILLASKLQYMEQRLKLISFINKNLFELQYSSGKLRRKKQSALEPLLKSTEDDAADVPWRVSDSLHFTSSRNPISRRYTNSNSAFRRIIYAFNKFYCNFAGLVLHYAES